MALMQDIVNDVLTELRFGAGVDVQIHLQEGIIRNISRCYRTLMKEFVWRDYHLVTPLILDETTGQAIIDLAGGGILTKYSNIIAVFLENDAYPLPFAPLRVNPAQIQRPSVVHSGGTQVFTVYPRGLQRNVILISRVFSEEDFVMEDDVPFYRDVLALCAALQLSIKAGTNDKLTEQLKQEYGKQLQLHVIDEIQDMYQLNNQVGIGMTDWWANS